MQSNSKRPAAGPLRHCVAGPSLWQSFAGLNIRLEQAGPGFRGYADPDVADFRANALQRRIHNY